MMEPDYAGALASARAVAKLYHPGDEWGQPVLFAGTAAALVALIDEQAATIAEQSAMLDALHAKLPNLTCACSYEAPAHVCGHHSPQLVAARATIDVLAGALRAAQSVLIEANSPTGIGEYEIDDAIHTAAAALAKIGGAE